MLELRQTALHWLCETDAVAKSSGVFALKSVSFNIAASAHICALQARTGTVESSDILYNIPGRPPKPKLVPPLQLPKRSMRTNEGRAALIHALAHIEFNAINLALDAIWRFDNMPDNYYRDWLKVAVEESYHFSLLNAHLQTLGFTYGDFSGHNSLWEMVDRTKNDVIARMALVPRTMEARGLDASPQLRNKFAQIGDNVMAGILDVILRDEIGHVAIGNIWFNWLCVQRNLEPITTFKILCVEYSAPTLKPPFNMDARKKAGFTEAELALL
jgi:uncharacterized ferritin-like protein (DUF455 family)